MYLPIREQMIGIQKFAYATTCKNAHTHTPQKTDALSLILQHIYANTQHSFHLIEKKKERGKEK